MSQVLLIVLGVYLAACYVYGGVLLVRLMKTNRVVRPISRLEPTELIRAAMAELEEEFPDEQRIAA